MAGPRAFRFSSIHSGDQLLVGRDALCDLQIADAAVSREHAVVTGTADGVRVRDLGSTNGTLVNDRRLGPGETAYLTHGDRLDVGATTLLMDLMDQREVAYLGRVQLYLLTAQRDPLTHLLPRKYVVEELPEMMKMHRNAAIPVSLVCLGIDHFTTINEAHGAQTGDSVLAAVARIARLQTRVSDPVVRFGNDVFVAMLSGCDESSALRVAQRIRRAIGRHHWASFGIKTVTVSVGVAELTDDLVGQEWIARADEALQTARSAGHNRCVRISRVA